ncbi:hypothetical protein [Bradyrhizobium sp.]|uniref:hypothetical protein n=1 Tax=Bradyrhizobium sp. TaxID=376 RepID=UPI00391A0133
MAQHLRRSERAIADLMTNLVDIGRDAVKTQQHRECNDPAVCCRTTPRFNHLTI